VVVQEIEFVPTLIGRHGVGRLIPGVADQLFGRHLRQWWDQFSLGLGPGWGEEGDLMAALGQPVGQQRDHPLDAAITIRRNGIPGRGDDGDAHGSSLLW
jgi:hypothetical protein